MAALKKAVTAATLSFGRGVGGGAGGHRKRRQVMLQKATMPEDIGGRGDGDRKKGNNLEGWDGEPMLEVNTPAAAFFVTDSQTAHKPAVAAGHCATVSCWLGLPLIAADGLLAAF